MQIIIIIMLYTNEAKLYQCSGSPLPFHECTSIFQFKHCIGLLSPVGNLTSTEVDHCTLRLTWTAPYTLQGVPINYYTINITRHIDGAVLRTDTTNTTEYLYSVSSLGETLEIAVTAVNDVGTGNAASTMTQTPSSSETLPKHCILT